MSMADRLPTSVLCERVFPLLDAADLCSCEAVRKDWCQLLRDPEMGAPAWKSVCQSTWRGKANMPFSYKGARETPFHKIKLTTHAIQKLTIKELREILALRGIDSRRFLEKAEFVREFIRSSPVQILGYSMEFESKWKASYVYALRDSMRSDISKDELVNAEWTFFIKHQPMHYEQFKFNWDGSVRSTMRGGISPSSRWFMRHFNPTIIQVDGYPELHVSRRKEDWGFKLENQYVVFYSDVYGCNVGAMFEREYHSERPN